MSDKLPLQALLEIQAHFGSPSPALVEKDWYVIQASAAITLVRHLYDLHVSRAHYAPAKVAALAREIMPYDAEAFDNQLPAYRVNPMAERLWAIEALQLGPGHARRYTDYSVHGYAGRIEGNSSTKATNDTDAGDMELA